MNVTIKFVHVREIIYWKYIIQKINQCHIKLVCIVLILIMANTASFSQKANIKDLDFLIDTWEVREDNKEKTWWETSTRTVNFTLDSTYIEIDASSLSSTGKERTYRWLIHYNKKADQFEMVSMFSNWHKILFDILEWDKTNHKLTIRDNNGDDPNEYSERYGEMIYDEDFNSYIWTGENKYGDRDKPSIWNYVEIGKRIDQ